MTQQPARGSQSDIVPQNPTASPADAAAHPEVVAPEVVEQMKDASAAAASEGTGVSGNLSEIDLQGPPPPPPPPAH
jgi:hypothetical protein